MPASHEVERPGGSLRERAARVFTLDTRSLAAYRIGLGMLLIADCLLRSRDLHLMLTPDGVLPPPLVRSYLGGPSHWSVALVHDATWWNALVLAAEGCAGLMMAVGLFTRVATVLGWIAVVSLIRRTVTANNSGDIWLACQLLWACFLPLAVRWSLDSGRRRQPAASAAFSVATMVAIFQLMAVYLGAGIAKLNASWFAGDAIRRCLSVHDHGTWLGMAVADQPGVTRLLQWAVPLAEIGLPLLLVAAPTARVRLAIIALAVAFHAGIGALMNVGLFAAVGIVAWLPLIPAAAWPAGTVAARSAGPGAAPREPIGLSRAAAAACGLLAAIAASGFAIQSLAGSTSPLPQPLATAVNLAFLPQEWRMFGTVRNQEQWVSCRARLADGRIVDPLRGGQPVTPGPPAGGFASLPNHRWHRFLWRLPEPTARAFAPAAAAAIARHWNATRPGEGRIVAVEIWAGAAQAGSGDGLVRTALLAAWPPRSATGAGSLERFLETSPSIETATAKDSEAR